jgi:hypothetical protein
MSGEIEKTGQISDPLTATRIGQPSSWVAQLIEEGMAHSLDSRETLGRCVLEQS